MLVGAALLRGVLRSVKSKVDSVSQMMKARGRVRIAGLVNNLVIAARQWDVRQSRERLQQLQSAQLAFWEHIKLLLYRAEGTPWLFSRKKL